MIENEAYYNELVHQLELLVNLALKHGDNITASCIMTVIASIHSGRELQMIYAHRTMNIAREMLAIMDGKSTHELFLEEHSN